MSETQKVSQMGIFHGSSRQLRRLGRSDYKKSDYWRHEASHRRRVWKRCSIACIVTALFAFLLAHGEEMGQRLAVTGLFAFVALMVCACILIIMYKNDINACKSEVSEWDSLRVGIGPKSMTVEHTSWRDSMGQYLGDIEPICVATSLSTNPTFRITESSKSSFAGQGSSSSYKRLELTPFSGRTVASLRLYRSMKEAVSPHAG